jgi:transcriptional regulator with XRE-family HTH domain
MNLSTDSNQQRIFPRLVFFLDGALRGPVPTGQKNPLWYRFAERLRGRVDASGMFRQDLAALVGLTPSVLVEAENGGHVPRLSTVERIGDALGISPAWLAYGEEGFLPFRQRRPKPVIPPDPPVPEPDSRAPRDRWRGVAERVAQSRRRLGLTLRQLGEAAGISGQGVMVIEKGRTEPLISTIEQLAVALDVAPGWLAFGEGAAPSVSEAEPSARPTGSALD